ncbi:hypothetical protein [Leucobacter denitrificans]|uniref:Secreted protein n=1 Tax=Leucobacter denitrificans TaxID=683042 RepID=A0A7G9S5R3_9MICO|nr:hypothetical protein [Leucobacter denitrificans]QNN63188.1 hypothetical protein H9L06_02185 [Leucobacter denitrificans]
MAQSPRITAGVLALGLLVLPLTACAEEPGAVGTGDPVPTEKQEPEGGSWPAENPDEVFEKSQEIPEDFPAEFVIPEGATIDDVGSRGFGTWYLVLRAEDQEASDAIWESIVTNSGFTVTDDAETVEGGRMATLESGALSASAMTIPGEDGSVLMSYDITAAVS